MLQVLPVCPLNNEFEKRVIWNFADEVEGRPPEIWRIDHCGSLICWPEYDQHTQFGWKIVLIHPERTGISISNKQALHWQNIVSRDRRAPRGRMEADG